MMTRKPLMKLVLMFLLLATFACGELRYAYLAPEAKDFHPKRIAVFPIEVWNHKEMDARTTVEQIVAGSLVERKSFDFVMDAETLRKRLADNDGLQNAVNDFFSKLRLVNFPDSALSRKIGEAAGIDSFLLVFVDEWKYIVEGDKKSAQVALTMEVYDVSTGKLMWKGSEIANNDYVIIKPELPKIARDVVRKMIKHIPRQTRGK